MKIYSIYHVHDIDGGIGDAVPVETYVASFESETDAKAFVEKYNKPYIYKIPYDELWCNEFVIRELEVIAHKDFDVNKTPEDFGAFIPERKEGK